MHGRWTLLDPACAEYVSERPLPKGEAKVYTSQPGCESDYPETSMRFNLVSVTSATTRMAACRRTWRRTWNDGTATLVLSSRAGSFDLRPLALRHSGVGQDFKTSGDRRAGTALICRGQRGHADDRAVGYTAAKAAGSLASLASKALKIV